MTEQKKDFEDKMGAAHEAEVDPDRRQMEEAILATIAKVGPDDPFSITFDKTYGEEMLAFSRPDLEAIARGYIEKLHILNKYLFKFDISSISERLFWEMSSGRS